MAFRPAISSTLAALGLAALLSAGSSAFSQVFVVGEKSATADVSTDFHPTRVELPKEPITERGRRELIRNLEAEQGFAHRPLPLGASVTLMANGNMTPNGDEYKQMLYKKGQVVAPGDRIAITAIQVKQDRIILDLNGGPYLKHRWLRHVDLNDNPMVEPDGAQVSGCRVTLVFEGGLPDVSAPEVKALLDPIIDFGVKSGVQAYADTLPPFLKDAIAHHDVLVGMNSRMVLAAMGAPQQKLRELVPGSDDAHYEEWIYGQMPQTVRFVRFQNDRVTQVRIAEVGKQVVVHDQNEMGTYMDHGDPDSVHEVAMGDAAGEGKAPPTILKTGEVAPGSQQEVQMPVDVPTSSGAHPTPVSDAPKGNPTGSNQ